MSIFNEETLEKAVIGGADLTGLTASLVSQGTRAVNRHGWQGYYGDLSGLLIRME